MTEELLQQPEEMAASYRRAARHRDRLLAINNKTNFLNAMRVLVLQAYNRQRYEELIAQAESEITLLDDSAKMYAKDNLPALIEQALADASDRDDIDIDPDMG